MKPTPNFDRLAPFYAGLEYLSFGTYLQKCRVAMLPHVHDCQRVLIVGDGDGRFLAALLDALPNATVDSFDISPVMNDLARKRLSMKDRSSNRVRFTVGDIRSDPLPGTGYDLIVTNFLLDCFPADEQTLVIDRLSQAALPDAKWIVGEFELPTSPWKRYLGRVALTGMYIFFRIVTRITARKHVDPLPQLVAHGWKYIEETSWFSGFLVSRLWTNRPEQKTGG